MRAAEQNYLEAVEPLAKEKGVEVLQQKEEGESLMSLETWGGWEVEEEAA